jgi:hypothetical protein
LEVRPRAKARGLQPRTPATAVRCGVGFFPTLSTCLSALFDHGRVAFARIAAVVIPLTKVILFPDAAPQLFCIYLIATEPLKEQETIGTNVSLE